MVFFFFITRYVFMWSPTTALSLYCRNNIAIVVKKLPKPLFIGTKAQGEVNVLLGDVYKAPVFGLPFHSYKYSCRYFSLKNNGNLPLFTVKFICCFSSFSSTLWCCYLNLVSLHRHFKMKKGKKALLKT